MSGLADKIASIRCLVRGAERNEEPEWRRVSGPVEMLLLSPEKLRRARAVVRRLAHKLWKDDRSNQEGMQFNNRLAREMGNRLSLVPARPDTEIWSAMIEEAMLEECPDLWKNDEFVQIDKIDQIRSMAVADFRLLAGPDRSEVLGWGQAGFVYDDGRDQWGLETWALDAVPDKTYFGDEDEQLALKRFQASLIRKVKKRQGLPTIYGPFADAFYERIPRASVATRMAARALARDGRALRAMAKDFVAVSEESNLREALADLAHEQWSGWMKYMFENWDDEHVARWERQMETPYSELSDEEQESDRKEADRVLAVLRKHGVEASRHQGAMVELPREVVDALARLPETGMGYQTILNGRWLVARRESVRGRSANRESHIER